MKELGGLVQSALVAGEEDLLLGVVVQFMGCSLGSAAMDSSGSNARRFQTCQPLRWFRAGKAVSSHNETTPPSEDMWQDGIATPFHP
ncbi:MAG: hypothetical protein ACK546_01095 [bacterium]